MKIEACLEVETIIVTETLHPSLLLNLAGGLEANITNVIQHKGRNTGDSLVSPEKENG